MGHLIITTPVANRLFASWDSPEHLSYSFASGGIEDALYRCWPSHTDVWKANGPRVSNL